MYSSRFQETDNGKSYFHLCAIYEYTLIHGGIHYLEVDKTGQLLSDQNPLFENVGGAASLALITGFALIGIKRTFEQVGKSVDSRRSRSLGGKLIFSYFLGLTARV